MVLTESARLISLVQPIFGASRRLKTAATRFRGVAMSMVPSNTRITPFLWFDGNAEEAVNFYLSVFKNSRRLDKMDSAVDTSVSKGKVLTISFELDGQAFVALNGGPNFKFNEAISFMIRCENQEEIDYYWSRLTADGGAEVQCGWLKDKFGLSWQVVPSRIAELVRSPKGMEAMMKMKKLDIAELERANKSLKSEAAEA
jgi:predicted 3-demethylubiquinone-9 3-methyltransferase (glyoxalase superfamily)